MIMNVNFFIKDSPGLSFNDKAWFYCFYLGIFEVNFKQKVL